MEDAAGTYPDVTKRRAWVVQFQPDGIRGAVV